MIKTIMQRLWDAAEKMYMRNIFDMLEKDEDAILLDCGCDDGRNTLEIAQGIGTNNIYGIEIIKARAHEAQKKGINVFNSDLNERFPLEDESVDVILANQVIEHLANADSFVGEIHRVLRRGGYAIVCTENLASWHNILSLVFGWQPFSLTNISLKRLGIGNPFALHRGEEAFNRHWLHVELFAYRGLLEIIEANGLKVEAVSGAGYYPLLSIIGQVDKRHAAFLTVKARKG